MKRPRPVQYIPNPACRGAIAAVKLLVTDRALRYRAQKNPPPGPKICCYCGSDRHVEIEHVDGKEENTAAENLTWACRSCNTRKGAFFARAGLGRKTRQFNGRGAKDVGEWMNAVLALQGGGGGLSPQAAVRRIQATPHARRAQYAREIAAAKAVTLRARNPEEPAYEQYLWAVAHHQRGAKDEGGAVIHATSKATRSEYAQKIARSRKFHGTSRITGKKSEVPF